MLKRPASLGQLGGRWSSEINILWRTALLRIARRGYVYTQRRDRSYQGTLILHHQEHHCACVMMQPLDTRTMSTQTRSSTSQSDFGNLRQPYPLQSTGEASHGSPHKHTLISPYIQHILATIQIHPYDTPLHHLTAFNARFQIRYSMNF